MTKSVVTQTKSIYATKESAATITGGTKMKTAFVTSIFAFVMYLFLSAGSGDIVLWSLSEIVMGLAVAILVGMASAKIIRVASPPGTGYLSPARWPVALAYLSGPFFIAMARANLDVAYRVITGNIRPGIVRISPGLKTDAAITALANSITLTPGTLTVDVDAETKDLFVHQINIPVGDEMCPTCDCEKVCGSFPKWIRRMFE